MGEWEYRAKEAVTSHAYLVIDGNGNVVEWSKGAERLLGYSADLMLGLSALDLPVLPTNGAGGGIEGDVVLICRDGRAIACALRLQTGFAEFPDGRWRIDLIPGYERSCAHTEMVLMDALFAHSPIGLFILDSRLRLVRVNGPAEKIGGKPESDVLGQRPSEAWPTLGGQLADQDLIQGLRDRKPLITLEIKGRPLDGSGRERVYSVFALRMQDPQARILGMACAVVDITDRKIAERRLALTSESGSRIGTTLDVLGTAQELAEFVIPQLADGVTVDILDSVLAAQDIAPGPAGPRTVLRRAATHSIRSNVPGVYAVGDVSTYANGDAHANQVLADRAPRLFPSVASDRASVVGDARRGNRMVETSAHSMMLVPLVVQGRVLGLVSFYRWSSLGPFQEEDLSLAADICGRAAVALDNGRRHMRERNAVHALQRAMLPQCLSTPSSVEAARHLVHAGAGGDWVDVIPLPGARVALVVGQAPGRGIRAAATMGRLRAAVHAFAAMDLTPGEVLARLDDLVHELTDENAIDAAIGAAGATCLYMLYDPTTGRCTMATAGARGLLISAPDGTVQRPELPVGEPLGCPGPPFEQAELALPSESVLALHTKGLLQEAEEGVGQAQLERLLGSSDETPPNLCRNLTEAMLPTPPRDDAAVLVARVHVLPPDAVATWELPADLAAVATARSLVADQLERWSLSNNVFETELVVSELVTNAIRHAASPVQVRLVRDRSLICEVSDHSSAVPHLGHPRTTDEGGRGLLMVKALTQRWGTRYGDHGKTIWAEQPIAARP